MTLDISQNIGEQIERKVRRNIIGVRSEEVEVHKTYGIYMMTNERKAKRKRK